MSLHSEKILNKEYPKRYRTTQRTTTTKTECPPFHLEQVQRNSIKNLIPGHVHSCRIKIAQETIMLYFFLIFYVLYALNIIQILTLCMLITYMPEVKVFTGKFLRPSMTAWSPFVKHFHYKYTEMLCPVVVVNDYWKWLYRLRNIFLLYL